MLNKSLSWFTFLLRMFLLFKTLKTVTQERAQLENV